MKISSVIVMFFLAHSWLFASVLHVGPGQTYSNLEPAANAAQPGDTIYFHAGIYAGGQFVGGLSGATADWITILADTTAEVIIQGNGTAWLLTDPSYIRISGFIFEQQTINGVNIDDGGDYSTPAHDLVVDNCTFRDISASGNNDLLKMSGVDDFEIRNCIFLNGSPGGSGIDMVGCHNGIVRNSHFENQGSNCLQAKGGSRYVTITQNIFIDGGFRSLNLGGSTGLQYFRPDTAGYEAADLYAYSNIFIGSHAPIAYVGCTRVRVVNNTIFQPDNWVVRILQENTDPRFIQCSSNYFRNNIIYYGDISTETNIGPNTLPSTFHYGNNLWYKYTNPSSTPNIPVPDTTMITGQDPLFLDTLNFNFGLASGSPAIGYILTNEDPQRDYYDRLFNNPRSIGALEANPLTSLSGGTGKEKLPEDFRLLSAYPNPFNPMTTLRINLEGYHIDNQQIILVIYNTLGERVKQIFQGSLTQGSYDFQWSGKNDKGDFVATGLYFAVLKTANKFYVERLVYSR